MKIKALIFCITCIISMQGCKQVITQREAIECQKAGGKVIFGIADNGDIVSAECVKK